MFRSEEREFESGSKIFDDLTLLTEDKEKTPDKCLKKYRRLQKKHKSGFSYKKSICLEYKYHIENTNSWRQGLKTLNGGTNLNILEIEFCQMRLLIRKQIKGEP